MPMGRLCPGDDDLGQTMGVDIDQLMRPNGLDDTVGRDRARGAEIGRAEDGDVGDRSGVFDEVADAHEIALHGGVGAQCRPIRLLGGGSAAECEQERQGWDGKAEHQDGLSQRINCEVVCSIWSAALMTLEFIS